MQLKPPTSTKTVIALCGILAAALAGCSSRNVLNTGAISLLPGKKQKRPIARIICVWKPAEGRDMKNRPARGLAGKILFFPANSEQPVKIEGDGTVVIYTFDDQGTPAEQTKPIHKFQFPLDAWNLHYRQSQLGPSYDVFIPYTRNIIHQVKMTAHVRLVPKEGPVATSSMDTVTIPGPKRKFDREALVHDVTSRRAGLKTRVSTLKDHARLDERRLGSPRGRRGRVFEPAEYDPREHGDDRRAIRQAAAVRDSDERDEPAALPKGELLRRFLETQERKKRQRLKSANGVIRRTHQTIAPEQKQRPWNLNDDDEQEDPRDAGRSFRLSGSDPQPRRGTRVSTRTMPTAFTGRGRFTPPAGSEDNAAIDDPRIPQRRGNSHHPLLGAAEKETPIRRTKEPRRFETSAPDRRDAVSRRSYREDASDSVRVNYSDDAEDRAPTALRRSSRIFERQSARALLEGN